MTASTSFRSRGSTGSLALPLAVALAAFTWVAAPLRAQATLPTIEAMTAGMERFEGFFDLFWDDAIGALYWEIPELDREFLYQISMGSGLGSNPIGIDRGQLRGTHVLMAQRYGPRVLLVEPNHRYVAQSPNEAEVKAVRDAFAPSVHWGFEVVAETDGRVLVEATDFFLRDARGVIEQISASGQGTFELDWSRSAIYLPAIRSFQDNTEVEAILTFTSRDPGELVRGVAADGSAVTLRQHHSFIRLPDDGYRTRIADPRVGVQGPTVYDYGAAIDQDMAVRLAARHRLQKANPGQERSRPVEPIVYYVDPGTPEPVRSAIIEGVSWWSEAFEAAGFVDAFRVEVLPEGVDPQDIRYNVIHWTHRRTRGYSYGNTVVDPRTGEIIRGVVNLGSLRLRQDYLHGQGLVSPFPGGIMSADACSYFDPPAAQGWDNEAYEACMLAAAPDLEYLAQVGTGTDPVGLALDRVRQLAAHEVGHTLGFPHNYIASSYGRESVMDYPAPLVEIDADGDVDLSNAYLQRIGEYDKLSVNWLYREFPAGTDEGAALGRIAERGVADGLIYMGHTNNTFVGASHQHASVWDNGSNLVDQLEVEIRVRQIGLDRFGVEQIRVGEPLSDLELVLLPLYMHHRFQLRSAAQSLGGADFRYALRGDGQTAYSIVDGAEQRRALDVLLSTLAVDFLALPERIVAMIPPPAYRHEQGEVFPGRTQLVFDALAAAEGAAAFTVGEILNPDRMARLVLYGSLGDYPSLEEVVDRLVEATWGAPAPSDEYRRQVSHVAQRAVIDRMMQQGSRDGNATEVRAVLSDRLDRLASELETLGAPTPHQWLAAADIRRWQSRIESTVPGPPVEMPPGDPIGGSSRAY